MGQESFDGKPKVEKTEFENTNKELASEQVEAVILEIKAKLAENDQHNADGHWAAAVGPGGRLCVVFGNEVLREIIEENGWSVDTFPSE
jgi:CHAD domain-containing protein